MVSPLIPLFPLGTVLFPGSSLALHIFEDRYRALMADLLDLPVEERRFGVVTIRSGREVGADGVRALHDVGCVCSLTAVVRAPDGSYDIETVGSTRFRVISLDSERPYLRAAVEWLAEPLGEVGRLDRLVADRYADYRAALGGLPGVGTSEAETETETESELPDDARLMSYVVAATVIADTGDRQRFLAEYDAAHRLAAEAAWLARESTLLRELSAVPAGRVFTVPFSIN